MRRGGPRSARRARLPVRIVLPVLILETPGETSGARRVRRDDRLAVATQLLLLLLGLLLLRSEAPVDLFGAQVAKLVTLLGDQIAALRGRQIPVAQFLPLLGDQVAHLLTILQSRLRVVRRLPGLLLVAEAPVCLLGAQVAKLIALLRDQLAATGGREILVAQFLPLLGDQVARLLAILRARLRVRHGLRAWLRSRRGVALVALLCDQVADLLALLGDQLAPLGRLQILRAQVLALLRLQFAKLLTRLILSERGGGLRRRPGGCLWLRCGRRLRGRGFGRLDALRCWRDGARRWGLSRHRDGGGAAFGAGVAARGGGGAT